MCLPVSFVLLFPFVRLSLRARVCDCVSITSACLFLSVVCVCVCVRVYLFWVPCVRLSVCVCAQEALAIVLPLYLCGWFSAVAGPKLSCHNRMAFGEFSVL